MWHKCVSIVVLNYNKSYHASIGCEPSRVFHGRIPYNMLDLKMGSRPQKIPPPDSQIAQDVLEQTEAIFQDVRKMPCKLISNTKRIMMGMQTPQNSNKPITSLYYSQKQITKGVKFPLQTFAGSGHILLKRCYPTIIIWYTKSALTRRKFFIE